MKRRYQIDRERAVRKFQKQAKHSEESLQLTLPLKEVAEDCNTRVSARQVQLTARAR